MLGFVRYGLPLGLALVGVLLIAVGHGPAQAAGITLVGVGALVSMANSLYRFGVSGDREREAEEEARRYYDRHGRWPDEDDG